MPTYEGDPKSYSVENLNANGLSGSCLCKAITIKITKKDLFAKPNGHICHCLNCRRHTSSSAWSVIVLLPEDITIEDPRGYMRNYHDGDTTTGKVLPRTFCSKCGSTLGNIPFPEERTPSTLVAIALGLFPRIPTPEFELFCAHRQEWLPAAVPQDKQYASREEMAEKF